MDAFKHSDLSSSQRHLFHQGEVTGFLLAIASCFICLLGTVPIAHGSDDRGSDHHGSDLLVDQASVWSDDDSVERTVILTSLASEGESENEADELPVLVRVAQNEIPASPQLQPAIAETSRRLFQTTPASKMTLRRDPPKNRFLGGEESGSVSIRAIQEQIQKSDEESDPDRQPPVFAESDWSIDEPYGKYLYIPHAPLLFEDIPAERYGEVRYPCFYPVVSFAKFMGAVPVLPYKIGTNYYAAYHEDGVCAVDHQGNLRPGILEGSYFPDCEIFKEYPRSNLAGGLTEAATVTGLIFLFP